MPLSIRIDSPTVILGDAESSSLLRGTVVLDLKEPTRFKAVRLVLVGRARLQWRDNAIKRTVLSREWSFLPAGSTSHPLLLPVGEHTWPFETMLEGHLPESVQGSSYGEIEYHLKAEGVRPIVKNLVCRMPLQVWREPCVRQGPVREIVHEDQVIAYEAVARKAIYGRGETVVVDMYAEQYSDWHVRSITTVFKEIVVLPPSPEEVRVLRFVREQGPFDRTLPADLRVRIPQFTQYDASNTLFSIRHQLEVTVTLECDTAMKKECRIALPIVVTQDLLVRAMTHEEDNMGQLPSYADALLPPLYMSPEFNTLYYSTSAPSSCVTTPADEPDHWLSFDCNDHSIIRLPSYSETAPELA
ncbi:hypothetical protein BX666DRAFT_2026072 [Dichotomocladium elegans]|nr:hypothetical protein BX666DRAFT_2026072 [Dichotomocladium elegans]